MLKNLELAVGTDTYIPEVEGIVPFHNCDSDEDTKELDAIIVTIDNDTNTIQELKAFQKHFLHMESINKHMNGFYKIYILKYNFHLSFLQ